jgi:hypothetical protein
MHTAESRDVQRCYSQSWYFKVEDDRDKMASIISKLDLRSTFERPSSRGYTIDMIGDSYRTRGNTQGAIWQVKTTKARNEDPALIHASRKPNTHHAFWSRKCDYITRHREEIPFTPAKSPAKPKIQTTHLIISPPSSRPKSPFYASFCSHCSLCLFYTRIVHFPSLVMRVVIYSLILARIL